MSKRRTSNVLAIPSAIVVYTCFAIGMHSGECQQEENVAFMLKTVCFFKKDFFKSYLQMYLSFLNHLTVKIFLNPFVRHLKLD